MPQMVMEGARTQTPPPRRAPLRRQRNFTLLWTGQTISMTGSAVTQAGRKARRYPAAAKRYRPGPRVHHASPGPA